MRYPLDQFWISQGFKAGHLGIDLATMGNATGVALKAPENGKITQVNTGWKPGGYFGGNYIKMKGDSGYSYYMGHCASVDVAVGNRVTEGQKIGVVGETGTASGNHTHMEMYTSAGVAVDASKLLTKGDNTMAEVNLDVARCFSYWVGRDGRDGRANGRKGETDADLIKFHVGKELTREYVFSWMNSGEMNENIKRLDAVYAERNSLRQQVKDLNAKLAAAVKPPASTAQSEAERKLQSIKDALK